MLSIRPGTPKCLVPKRQGCWKQGAILCREVIVTVAFVKLKMLATSSWCSRASHAWQTRPNLLELRRCPYLPCQFEQRCRNDLLQLYIHQPRKEADQGSVQCCGLWRPKHPSLIRHACIRASVIVDFRQQRTSPLDLRLDDLGLQSVGLLRARAVKGSVTIISGLSTGNYTFCLYFNASLCFSDRSDALNLVWIASSCAVALCGVFRMESVKKLIA